MKVTKEIQTGEFLLSSQRTIKEPIFVDNGRRKEHIRSVCKAVKKLILTVRQNYIFLRTQ
jgi:hypothetical protein